MCKNFRLGSLGKNIYMNIFKRNVTNSLFHTYVIIGKSNIVMHNVFMKRMHFWRAIPDQTWQEVPHTGQARNPACIFPQCGSVWGLSMSSAFLSQRWHLYRLWILCVVRFHLQETTNHMVLHYLALMMDWMLGTEQKSALTSCIFFNIHFILKVLLEKISKHSFTNSKE